MPDKGLTEQNTSGGDDEGQRDDILVIPLKGRDIELRSPGSGALAMFAKASAQKDGGAQVAGVLEFFERRMVHPEDREWFEEEMLEDRLSLEDVSDAIESMMEEWGERPTERSSASSSSSMTSGRPSTGARRKVVKG